MARNLPTELILLEIASGLKNLIKDPKLDEAIKSAYALSESEKNNAEEARQIIAKSKDFLADIEKQKSQYADVEERIKQAKDIEAQNAATAEGLASKERDIEKSMKESNKKLQEVANAVAALQIRENAASEKERKNKETEDRLNKFEAKLLGTANILSNTVQDLSA